MSVSAGFQDIRLEMLYFRIGSIVLIKSLFVLEVTKRAVRVIFCLLEADDSIGRHNTCL